MRGRIADWVWMGVGASMFDGSGNCKWSGHLDVPILDVRDPELGHRREQSASPAAAAISAEGWSLFFRGAKSAMLIHYFVLDLLAMYVTEDLVGALRGQGLIG